MAKSHIIVLDALLKLRQICCHPQLLKSAAAQKITESAKLDYLTGELLPTLLEEGRRILLFSQFTSMLDLIKHALLPTGIPYVELRGDTADRAQQDLRDQVAETNRDLMELQFRVDSHSREFRPLRSVQDSPYANAPGVLPPRDSSP